MSLDLYLRYVAGIPTDDFVTYTRESVQKKRFNQDTGEELSPVTKTVTVVTGGNFKFTLNEEGFGEFFNEKGFDRVSQKIVGVALNENERDSCNGAQDLCLEAPSAEAGAAAVEKAKALFSAIGVDPDKVKVYAYLNASY